MYCSNDGCQGCQPLWHDWHSLCGRQGISVPYVGYLFLLSRSPINSTLLPSTPRLTTCQYGWFELQNISPLLSALHIFLSNVVNQVCSVLFPITRNGLKVFIICLLTDLLLESQAGHYHTSQRIYMRDTFDWRTI